jgi:hypothetical protein
LALGSNTIPILLERTRDVAPEVRKEVYKAFLKGPLDILKSAQMINLLQNGIYDRDPKVVKHCHKLVQKYAAHKGLLPFLHSLDPQKNQKLIEKLILFLVAEPQFDLSAVEPLVEYAVEYNILRRVFIQCAFDAEVSHSYLPSYC